MNMAKNHAAKVARAIVAYAVEQGVDVVIFKHFYYRPRRKGTERTDIWRKCATQDLMEHEAHLHGMRVSRVCAQGVSSLAFDGSGEVIRGAGSDGGNCRFQNGKTYSYKLNALYNSGARYFLREMPRQI